MQTSTVADTYNEVHYPLLAFYWTHPGYLRVIGTLLGMDIPDVQQCRVLELGCAAGANLFGMAMHLPQAQFVGIDLAAQQIQTGLEMKATLGIGDNLRLEVMDVTDVPADFGEFDFIIAHGMLSWIPSQAREGIVDVFQKHLAPHGIAYLSYNVLPGYSIVQAINHLMHYHADHITAPLERYRAATDVVRWARDTIDSIDKDVRGEALELYAGFLNIQLEADNDRPPHAMLHDELSIINEPFYFHQVVEMAQAHGLQYLTDAHYFTRDPVGLPYEAIEQIEQFAGDDPIKREQYMDFLTYQRFRRSLFVREDVELDLAMTPDRIKDMYFRSRSRPADDNDPTQFPVHFTSNTGLDIELEFEDDHQLTAAALAVLTEEIPHARTFDELVELARQKLGVDTVAPVMLQNLLDDLLLGFEIDGALITPDAWRPDFPDVLPARPTAHPVSRLLLQRDDQVVNRWHERYVEIEPVKKLVLMHLDGSRDRSALLSLMQQWLTEGKLVAPDEISDTDAWIQHELDITLHWIFEHAFLMPAS